MWFRNIFPWQRRSYAPTATLAELRILLVEDNYDPRRRILHALREAGASVDLECCGRSAVDTVERRREEYDAVLFDLEAPLPDQVDTIRRLRQDGTSPAIIGLAARREQEIELRWLACGCDAVLWSPIDCLAVRSAILAAAAKRVSPPEPPLASEPRSRRTRVRKKRRRGVGQRVR